MKLGQPKGYEQMVYDFGINGGGRLKNEIAGFLLDPQLKPILDDACQKAAISLEPLKEIFAGETMPKEVVAKTRMDLELIAKLFLVFHCDIIADKVLQIRDSLHHTLLLDFLVNPDQSTEKL